MLEQLMHKAQMMKQQGKRIGQIAEALGKSERMVHYYLSEPSRSAEEAGIHKQAGSIQTLHRQYTRG
jgi:transcriptional antiterminator